MTLLVKFWSFVKSPGTMATLTIVGFAFGIYGTLFYEKRHALTFEILSNTSVYDVRENLNKLQIFYAGQNLGADKKTLRLISLRITNSGETYISKAEYDEAEPLGFAIEGGEILEIPKFTGSNPYLHRQIRPTLTSPNSVTVAPVILDAGESLEVQALVLTREGVVPRIRPLGKIAGIRTIGVSEPFQAKNKSGIWSQVWDANSIWIHLARAPAYGLLAILLLMAFTLFLMFLAMPVEAISNLRSKWSREAKIREKAQGRPLTVADQFILEEYKNNGERSLGRLNQFVERISQRNHFIESVKDHLDEETTQRILRTSWPIRGNILTQLESTNLVRHEGSRILIDADLARALNEFADLMNLPLQELGREAPERIYYELALAHEEGAGTG